MKSSRSIHSSRENGTVPRAGLRHVVRVVAARPASRPAPSGIVGDHDLERPSDGHDARHPHVEIVADGVLERRELDPRHARPRHADRVGEGADAPRASRRGGAVPRSSACRGSSQPVDVPFVHEPEQLPLAQHRVVELEPGELGLLRRPLEARLAHEPVVELAVVLELERAERVRDALDRVGQPVGEVVQRIQAPRRRRCGSAPRGGSAAAADRA